MAKHFLKTLIIFMMMIILGLVGVFLITRFGDGEKSVNTLNEKIQIAK